MRAKILYATLVAGALAVLVYAVPAVAHHAFGAEFDPDAPIRLQVNPHSWIHLEITQDDGTKEVWMVEGGTPNVLQRRGLRRECLPIGTELIVDGYQAKDHSLTRANGRDVTFTDGTKFFLGSSGTGAPTDGAETRGRSNPARC